MISARVIKHIGWRVKLFLISGSTYYEWDAKNEQIVIARSYCLYSMVFGFFAGFILIFAECTQLYLKLNEDDIPDDELDDDQQQYEDDMRFASIIIQFGEILLIQCIIFLNVVSYTKIEAQMDLVNHLIRYNKALQEMQDSGKLVLERKHKITIYFGELLIYITLILSLFLPLGIVIAIMHPIEPIHVILEEWFEMEVSLTNPRFYPLLILFIQATYCCGTTISIMTIDITMYYVISTITTDAFTPEGFAEGHPKDKRCTLQTRCFGQLSDDEIIKLYRTQQILNTLLNEFYKSVFISFHHVGLLAGASSLITFAIRYQNILSEEGAIAYIVVFSSIGTIILLIQTQTTMAGAIVDISNEFQEKGMKLTGRRLLYHKFCKTCKTFYLQVAFPFYLVHKETFLLFCEQVLDYVLNLLLFGSEE